jgi:hypothetical protein
LLGVYLLFSASLAWHLAELAQSIPHAIGAMKLTFFTLQIAGLILSWIYFPVPPVNFSAALVICMGLAAGQVRLRQAN